MRITSHLKNLSFKALEYRALNLILLIITYFLFAISSIVVTYSDSMQFILILVVFVVIGLPHGSMDHVIYRQLKKSKNNINLVGLDKKYLSNSVMIMAAYILVWVLSPLIGFILFIFISAFHFGESQLHYYSTKSKTVNQLIFLFWGINVLLAVMIFNIDETQAAVSSIFPHFSKEDILLEKYQVLYFTSSCAVNLLGLLFLKVKQTILFSDLLIEILILITLFVIFYFLPLFVGFLFYFGIWHSVKAVQQIFIFQKKQGETYSIKKFYAQTVFNTIVSIVLIAITLLIDNYFNLLGDHILLFFIIVSIITLPHFLLFTEINLKYSKN